MRNFLKHNQAHFHWILFGLVFLALVYGLGKGSALCSMIFCFALPFTMVYMVVRVLMGVGSAVDKATTQAVTRKRHVDGNWTIDVPPLDETSRLLALGDDGELIELDADEKRKRDDSAKH